MSLEFNVDQTLDARGKSCPGPVIALRKAMKTLDNDQVIKVLATDPGSQADFKAWCEETGNELLQAEAANGVFTYYIRKVEE
ncbi:MAG TPA: sulfurtransferase TusA family protein [Chloroflexia bacterium]|nr:sulfurtransferase TusA family protein [Chloroflexia bacterium]